MIYDMQGDDAEKTNRSMFAPDSGPCMSRATPTRLGTDAILEDCVTACSQSRILSEPIPSMALSSGDNLSRRARAERRSPKRRGSRPQPYLPLVQLQPPGSREMAADEQPRYDDPPGRGRVPLLCRFRCSLERQIADEVQCGSGRNYGLVCRGSGLANLPQLRNHCRVQY